MERAAIVRFAEAGAVEFIISPVSWFLALTLTTGMLLLYVKGRVAAVRFPCTFTVMEQSPFVEYAYSSRIVASSHGNDARPRISRNYPRTAGSACIWSRCDHDTIGSYPGRLSVRLALIKVEVFEFSR